MSFSRAESRGFRVLARYGSCAYYSLLKFSSDLSKAPVRLSLVRSVVSCPSANVRPVGFRVMVRASGVVRGLCGLTSCEAYRAIWKTSYLLSYHYFWVLGLDIL
jgi:hypothetical protein